MSASANQQQHAQRKEGERRQGGLTMYVYPQSSYCYSYRVTLAFSFVFRLLASLLSPCLDRYRYCAVDDRTPEHWRGGATDERISLLENPIQHYFIHSQQVLALNLNISDAIDRRCICLADSAPNSVTHAHVLVIVSPPMMFTFLDISSFPPQEWKARPDPLSGVPPIPHSSFPFIYLLYVVLVRHYALDMRDCALWMRYHTHIHIPPPPPRIRTVKTVIRYTCALPARCSLFDIRHMFMTSLRA